MVYDLDDEDINRLAAESDGTRSERTRCTEKLSILEIGLHDLKRLDKHRALKPGEGTFSLSYCIDIIPLDKQVCIMSTLLTRSTLHRHRSHRR